MSAPALPLTEPKQIRFRIMCVPPKTSHHAKKIVRIGKFSRLADKPELVASKAMLDSLLMPFQPQAPVSGPVELILTFTWPYRASEPKRNRGRLIYHTSRPDCSNLAKTLEDRLVALCFLEDDNAVCRLVVAKFWGESPGIEVQITQF